MISVPNGWATYSITSHTTGAVDPSAAIQIKNLNQILCRRRIYDDATRVDARIIEKTSMGIENKLFLFRSKKNNARLTKNMRNQITYFDGAGMLPKHD